VNTCSEATLGRRGQASSDLAIERLARIVGSQCFDLMRRRRESPLDHASVGSQSCWSPAMLIEFVEEIEGPILFVPPGVHLSEAEPLIEDTGRRVLREHVQRRRPQAPLQHCPKKRTAKADPLVVRIDEQLVDVRSDCGEKRYDGLTRADDPSQSHAASLPAYPRRTSSSVYDQFMN
jgi:hypothetical protein